MKKIKFDKTMLKNLPRFIIPLAIMIVMAVCFLSVNIISIKSENNNVYVKAVVTEVTADYTEGDSFSGTQTVTALVKTGEYKGQECTLENSNSYQRGAYCTEGTKVIALIRAADDGSLTGSVYNYDRTGMLGILIAIFAIAVILVGGRKGVSSLYALIFTFVTVICMYVPMMYSGINGILAAILSAFVILAVSIFILHGWSKKSICSMAGTVIGVGISGIASLILGSISNLSGYNMSDVESMIYISNSSGLDVANILYAGIIISSLGAVMDVSVSVVSSMNEVNDKAPKLSFKELFMSGIHVGRDMIGTMSNTLILAYTGSASCVLLTVFAYEMPFLQITAYNSIIIEILCGLCGTLGVVLTVPVQAVITALVLKRKGGENIDVQEETQA